MKDWLSIQSYIHARDKEKPVPESEIFISQNGETAYLYALRVLHGRFELGEYAISRCPEWAVRYARFIMRKRFPAAEKYISQHPESCYLYFKHVTKKKLPKKMHRAMISMGFKFPNNYYVAKYMREIGILGP